MKKILSLLLSIFFILNIAGVIAFAQDSSNIRFEIVDGEAVVTAGVPLNDNGVIEIPDTYQGYPVTKIGEDAFWLRENIKKVILPDSIVEIGDGAFSESNLTEIELSNNLKIIGSSAFSRTELKKISIPESVVEIGGGAFGLTNIERIVIPRNVKKIGGSAFFWCSNLTEVVLDCQLEVLSGGMFENCYNLNSVILPETLKVIGPQAFVESVRAIRIPDGVIDISDNAFDKDTIIYGSKGSEAEFYAEINGNEFYIFDDVSHKHFCFGGYCVGCKQIWKGTEKPIKIEKLYNILDGVYILWEEVKEAEYYNVYYKEENALTWEKVTTTLHVSHSIKGLKSNTTYEFAVRATNGELESAWNTQKLHFLQMPKIRYSNTVKGIVVKWNAIEGAEKYNIYRRRLGDQGFDKIATVDADETLKFIDTDVKSGNRFVYGVTAVNEKGESGYRSVRNTATFLLRPKLKNVKNTLDGIEVSWGRVKMASGYIIYRKTGSQGWQRIGRVEGGGTLNYVDKTAENGVTYKYTVRAYNNVGVDHDVLSPYYSGISIKHIEAPDITSKSNALNGIKVTWDKISGVDGYYVYRKAGNAKDWSRIATIKGGSTVSYLDKKVKNAVQYQYTVRGYDGDLKGSYVSDDIKAPYVSAPKIVSAQSTKNGIKINWGEISKVDGYQVYRRVGNGSWKRVGTVNDAGKTSFVDKSAEKGVTYRYTVRAVKDGVRSSYYSAGILIKDKY